MKPRSATALTLIGRSSGCAWAAREPLEHAVERVAPGELEEAVGGERVERDVDAPQAGGDEVGDLRLEQVAVRGQREVVDARRARDQRPDEPHSSLRTSGSPPVRRTSWTPISLSIAHEPGDLLVA